MIQDIINMFKIRFIKDKRYILIMLTILTALYFILTVYYVRELFIYNEGTEAIIFKNYFYVIGGVVLAKILSVNNQYLKEEYKLQVVPQNNKTRFISNYIYSCTIWFAYNILIQIGYLLKIIIIKIIMHYNNNIKLMYDISYKYLFVTVVTSLLYGMMIIAVIELIKSISMKSNKISLGIILTILLIVVLYFSDVLSQNFGQIVSSVFYYLLDEQSVGVFVIYALITILLLVCIAFTINNTINFYEIKNEISEKRVSINTILLLSAFIILILANCNNFENNQSNNDTLDINAYNLNSDDLVKKIEKNNEVDISKLDKDNFEIKFEGFEKLKSNQICVNINSGAVGTKNINELNDDIKNAICKSENDKMTISFLDLSRIVYNYGFIRKDDSCINVDVEENILHIKYVNAKNNKVVYLQTLTVPNNFKVFDNLCTNRYDESYYSTEDMSTSISFDI